MAKDLTVILEDRPGTLADVGEALGKAGVNIEGMCGFPSEGKGIGHLLVEDAEGALRALESLGVQVAGEREVLVIPVEDRPGVMGEIARKLAASGVNIELAYLGTNNRLVLGVDDLAAARSAV